VGCGSSYKVIRCAELTCLAGVCCRGVPGVSLFVDELTGGIEVETSFLTLVTQFGRLAGGVVESCRYLFAWLAVGDPLISAAKGGLWVSARNARPGSQ
jgi:hypothetical protein